jgi:hypothetical protein
MLQKKRDNPFANSPAQRQNTQNGEILRPLAPDFPFLPFRAARSAFQILFFGLFSTGERMSLEKETAFS